jgi:parvulin-like peptidyl-prolyl isomerase
MMANRNQKNRNQGNSRGTTGWKGWRIVIPTFAAILGIMVGLVGRPYLDKYVLVPNAVVAKVNGQAITLTQFEKYAQISRSEEAIYYSRLDQYINLYTQYGLNVSTTLTQNLAQMKTELTDPKVFGQSVLSKMIDNVLLDAQAKLLGVKVTDADITKVLQDSFGYYPNGKPTAVVTPTAYVEPTFSVTQLSLLATPTLALELLPTATEIMVETPTAIPTLEPTIPLPTETTSFTETPVPTATPLSLKDYQTEFNSYMAQLTPYGLTEADLRIYIYYQLLYNKVFTEVTKNIPTHGPQVWVRHILVTTEADANTALTRLQSGESWSSVAANISLDSYSSSYGGDLGWVPSGILTGELDKVVFAMKVGEIQIVSDSSGWHVIQVLGTNPDRPIDQNYVSRLQNIAYSNWYSPILSSANTITNPIWQTHVPSEPVLPTSTSQ